MTVLWRSTEKASPYFGRGSYWAAERALAEEVARFNTQDSPLAFGAFALYQTVVDTTHANTHVYVVPLQSQDAQKTARNFPAEICWCAFRDERWPQSLTYLYLGDAPVPADFVTDLRS